jgi:hypothetical protein
MEEVEWLAGSDPAAMLSYLEAHASGRKLRLFACACVRRYWGLLRWPRPREGVEAAERFADRLAGAAELEEARQRAEAAAQDPPEFERFLYVAAAAATAEQAVEAARGAAEGCRQHAVQEAASSVAPWENEAQITAEASAAECAEQARLLRELFGNPFRPVQLRRAWLGWGDGAVAGMAGVLDAGHRFAELPYLADALEDAGCTAEPLLRHLREPAGHVRGCWALDLLLGRE